MLLKKRIFILNGSATSGKDSFVRMVNEIVPSLHYSYVSNTKNAAKEYFGWDNDKSEKGRKFVAYLNYLSEKYNDKPFKDVKSFVKDFLKYDYYDKYADYNFLFIDTRQIKVIERMKREFNAQTIFVSRDGVEAITSNYADAQTKRTDYEYDFYIKNDGRLNDLKETAGEFVRYIKQTI